MIPHLEVAWDAASGGSPSSGVFGRVPNGAGPFQALDQASPGESNEITLIDAPTLVSGLVLVSAGSSSVELEYRMSQAGTLFYCATTDTVAALQFAAEKIVQVSMHSRWCASLVETQSLSARLAQGECPENTHTSGSVVVPELFAKLNRTLLITELRAARTYRIVVSTQGINNAAQSKVYSVLAETQVCGNSEVMVGAAQTLLKADRSSRAYAID